MERTLFPDAAQWAQDNFAAAALGLQARTDRLVHTAGKLALHPEGSLPARLDWNELRAFYGLVHRPEASPQALLGGCFAHTRELMTQTPGAVLIVHDTTELDFTDHPACQ